MRLATRYGTAPPGRLPLPSLVGYVFQLVRFTPPKR